MSKQPFNITLTPDIIRTIERLAKKHRMPKAAIAQVSLEAIFEDIGVWERNEEHRPEWLKRGE